MARDNLNRKEMTFERAEDIVAHVARERERWGKHYTGDDIGLAEILDALIYIFNHESQREKELKDSQTLLNRQLAAANAREARMKKQIAVLKGESEDESVE